MVDSLISNNRVLHMNYTQVISGAYRYKRIVIFCQIISYFKITYYNNFIIYFVSYLTILTTYSYE